MSQGDEPVAILIACSGSAALRIDGADHVIEVCNLPQLIAWLKLDEFEPGSNANLAPVLDNLFDVPQSQRIRTQIDALRVPQDSASSALLLVPARIERLALRQRWFEVSLHAAEDDHLTLLLTDVSERQELALALEEARGTRDLAMTVLRSDPLALRNLREAGSAAVTALRATLRMQARNQEAVQGKLARMQLEVDGLGGQAQMLTLTALALACDELTNALGALRQQENPSGDAMLPLAPRIDSIAVVLNELDRIDEQRARPSAPKARPVPAPRPSVTPIAVPWHEASESRWRTYVHQTGDSMGVLARLKYVGAEVVPSRLRRHVDAILRPLLDNSLQHGIEDLERRLKAHKPAAGQITVSFRDMEADGIEMTVHDDGAGFDVERIGRAAVASGLLSEETLETQKEARLVGLIFRPTFTTEGLPGNEGRGKGMSTVRRTITRLGGKIAVTTKRHRYTLFTIRLPALTAATSLSQSRISSAS